MQKMEESEAQGHMEEMVIKEVKGFLLKRNHKVKRYKHMEACHKEMKKEKNGLLWKSRQK